MPNPNNVLTVMGILQQVLPNDVTTGLPNTVIGQNQASQQTSMIFVQQKFQMAQQGFFPAVNLSAGKQEYRSEGLHQFAGSQVVICEYYDRWDTQPNTIDAICSTNLADLEIMKSNLESNNALVFGGRAYAISIPIITVSDYKGTFDTSFPGMTLIMHTLMMHINVLPYDV